MWNKWFLIMLLCFFSLPLSAQFLEKTPIPESVPMRSDAVPLLEVTTDNIIKADEEFFKRAKEFSHPKEQYDYTAHVPKKNEEGLDEDQKEEYEDQIKEFLNKLYIRNPKKFANLVIFPIGFNGLSPSRQREIANIVAHAISKKQEKNPEQQEMVRETKILDSVFEIGKLLFFPLISAGSKPENLLEAMEEQLTFPILDNKKDVINAKKTIEKGILNRRKKVSDSIKDLKSDLKKGVEIDTDNKISKKKDSQKIYMGYLKDGQKDYSFAYNKETKKLVEIPSGLYSESGGQASKSKLGKVMKEMKAGWNEALEKLDSDKDFTIQSARAAAKVGDLKVTETGKMGELKVTNTSGKNILIIDGEYSPGCSPPQHRITAKSTIIPPAHEGDIGTSTAGFCSEPARVIQNDEMGIEARHDLQSGDAGSGMAPVELRSTILDHAFGTINQGHKKAESTSGAYDTPDSLASKKVNNQFDPQVFNNRLQQDNLIQQENQARAQSARSTQFAVWSQLERLAASIGETEGERASVVSLLDSKKELTEIYNKAFEFKKNTVGVIVFVDGLFLIADIFNESSSFAARKDALIKSYAFSAVKNLTKEEIKNRDFSKSQEIEKSTNDIFDDVIKLFDEGEYFFEKGALAEVLNCYVKSDLKKASVMIFGDMIPHIAVFDISRPKIEKVFEDRVVLSHEGMIKVMKVDDEIQDCFRIEAIEDDYVEFHDFRSQKTYKLRYDSETNNDPCAK